MKTRKQIIVKNKWLATILGLAVMLFITSCDDDDDDVLPVQDVAFVSLYNASPNSPDMDILVDNRQINVYPFEYADYTGYLRFYTGERLLQFGPFDAANVVEDTMVTFNENVAYSVFIVDEYPEVDALVLEDTSDEPAPGNAKIRFIHLSPDAPSVDLTFDDGATVLADNQAFRSVTDFMDIDADSYDFEVRADAESDVLLSVPDIDIEAGWFYTFVVRGYADPPGSSERVLSADVIVN